MRRIPSFVLSLCLLATPLLAQGITRIVHRHGSFVGERVGRALAPLDDLDGDGVAEVAFAFRTPGVSIGRVAVASGLDGTLLRWHGNGAVDDGFGLALARLGDVEGDGIAELAVGCPGMDGVAPATLVPGKVFLYSGFDGSLLRILEGTQPGDGFGSSLVDLGDLDGDGWPELGVGAFSDLNPAALLPSISIFSGRDGALLLRIDATMMETGWGASLCGLGDVNGDGRGDVALGIGGANSAGLRSGRVEIRSGLDGSVIASVPGAAAEERLGSALLAAGDRNGDGRGDFWAGAPRGLLGVVGGSITLRSGLDASVLATIPTPISGFRFGAALSGIADQDGDLLDDLVVGAPGSPFDPGGLFVVSSQSGAVLFVRTSAVGTGFGSVVAAAMGDGGANPTRILTGAPQETMPTPNTGRVLAFESGTPLPLWDAKGSDHPTDFGQVRHLDDVNADGVDDILILSRQNPTVTALTPGFVRVLDGATQNLVYRFDLPLGQLEPRAEGIGDLNGDGHGDFVIGYPEDGGGTGRLDVHSGLDGSLIDTVVPVNSGLRYASAITSVSDVDFDGVPEILLGYWPSCTTPTCAGHYQLLSGATRTPLRSGTIASPGALGGFTVGDLGDLDGDGSGDYLISAVSFPNLGPGNSLLWAQSGASGQSLWARSATAPNDSFGASLHTGRDIDGDGVSDLIVGAPLAGSSAGGYSCLSGVDGSVIDQQSGSGSEQMGSRVLLVPDVNGDGRADVAVSILGDPVNERVELRSGLDGSILCTLRGGDSHDGFGSSLADLGDLDGDGFDEIGIGAPQSLGFGAVFVQSIAGAFRYREGGVPNLSLDLDFVPSASGILGHGQIVASSGTPGQQFGAAVSTARDYLTIGPSALVLDFDAILGMVFGNFDANGSYAINLNLVHPPLAGQDLFAQFIEIDLLGPIRYQASNGLRLRFAP